MLWVIVGVIAFILVGGIIGVSQGGNAGEIGCSYLVLGLLVLAGFWAYRHYQEGQAVEQMVGFKDALNRFRDDCGRYPSSPEGLSVLIRRPANCQAWKPYLDADEIPRDPWGHPYVYSPSSDGSFRITSGGRKSDEESDDITLEEPNREKPSGE